MRGMIARQNVSVCVKSIILSPQFAKFASFAMLVSFFITSALVIARSEEYPHNATCNSKRCRKVETYLECRYGYHTSTAPFGNSGPAPDCVSVAPSGHGNDFTVLAEISKDQDMRQIGEPPSEIRNVVLGEMRKIGLPPQEDKSTLFVVWKSSSADWTLAEGYFYAPSREDRTHYFTVCEVIVAIDQKLGVLVLRKTPFLKTRIQGPEVTLWYPLDLADADGDGRPEVILNVSHAYTSRRGEAGAVHIEGSWLEVISVQHGSFETIFTGRESTLSETKLKKNAGRNVNGKEGSILRTTG
jgi:hypothetical protein